MNFIPHQLAAGTLVAEIEAEGIVMGSVEEALQVLGDAYYNGFDRVMVRVEQLNPDFIRESNKGPHIRFVASLE